MKRLRPLWFFVALAAVAAALLVLRGEAWRAYTEAALKTLIERQGSALLGAPLHLDAVRLGALPPVLSATGLALGDQGAVARAQRVDAQVLLDASLREWRLVIEVAVDGLEADVPELLAALPSAADGPVDVPPLRVRLALRGPRARLGRLPDVQLVDGRQIEAELSVDRATRQLALAVDAGELRVRIDGRPLAIDALALRLDEAATGWWLRSLGVAGPGLALRAAEEDAALQVSGEVDLAQLAWLDEAAARLQGTAALRAQLDGPLQAATLRGAVSVVDLAVDGRALGDARAEFVVDRHHAEIKTAQLEAAGGVAKLSGALQLDDALSYRAQIRVGGVELRELAAVGAFEVPALTGHGVFALSGSIRPLDVVVEGDGQIAAAGDIQPLTWQGGGHYRAGVGGARIELAQGAANRARGEWSLGAGEALSGELTLQVRDIDGLRGLLPIALVPALRADVTAAARFADTLSAPQLDGQLSVRDLLWAGVSVPRLDARVVGDRQALRSKRVEMEIGGGTVAIDGLIALDATAENRWALRASKIDGGVLAALLHALSGVRPPVTGGTLSLEASAAGPWPGLRLDAAARLDDVSVAGEEVARVRATLRADGGRWALDASAHNRAGQRVNATASGRGSDDLRIDLHSDGWTLTSASRDAPPRMGGTVRLSAALRGAASALGGHVALDAAELVFAARRLGALSLSADGEDGQWHGTAAALGGALNVRAQVRRERGHPFVVDAEWRAADLTPLLTAQAEPRVESTGMVRVEGRLAALEESVVSLQVSALTISNGPLVLTPDGPLVGRCANRTCRLERAVFRSGDTTLAVVAEAGVDGRARLALQGGGSLELLEVLGEPIESARGRFSVEATVAYGAAGWETRGQVAIEQFALDAGLAVAISRTDGRLTMAGDTVRIDRLEGRMGSGRFTLAGVIDWQTGPLLTWELIDVGVDPSPALELEVSGRGDVTGTWQAPRLSGELEVARLLYDRDITLADLLPSFNRALAAAPLAAGSRAVILALHIVAPGELYVENNVARLEARADLRIGGTSARPVLAGRVEALDGEIYVRGRTFELSGATADFRPDLGLAAALNLSAESFINTPEAAYAVAIRVTGTTADPRVTLSSDDPTLSQTDIATLIAVGKTTSQLRAGGISVYDALGIVPAQVAGEVEGPARRLLPVDRIEFEPSFSRTSGAFEPQLKVGKDLTESVSASVGQTFGVASRTRVQIDYRLGPRVTLPLSWESQTETEAGAFASGVELRYEFWRLTPFTLLSGLW